MTRRRDKRIIPLCLGIFVAVSSFAFLINRSNRDVKAADLSKFRPGNIISDYMMSNYRSMTKDEIQAFLTKKNPCSNRNRAYYDELVRLNPGVRWHWKDDHFVCISEELFGDGETIGEGKTAAEIIYETAEEYKINPQVLIVLIQKESGLITDPIPNNYDYRTMTGFGCPDTAPCSSQYFGFKNQLRKAAWLFREVLDGGWTNYPLGENYVQYSPNAACGGSIVNIENLATSSLYRYTPYQPNAAAIAAGTGTAPCGAYGNRNFYAYFSDWFGDPTRASAYEFFITPRDMITNKKAERINPFTGEVFDTIEKDLVLKYVTKIKVDGKWYYRSETCTYGEIDAVVSADDVSEIHYENIEPTYMETQAKVPRINPFNNAIFDEIDAGRTLQYTSRIKRSDGWYYRSKVCTDNQYDAVISEKDLKELVYEPFYTPRYMKIKENTEAINPFTKTKVNDISAGTVFRFNTKIKLLDGWYYRTEKDSEIEKDTVVPASAIEEVNIYYEDFYTPRYMKVSSDAKAINPFTGEEVGTTKAGEVSKYSTKIEREDGWYYRTEKDSEIEKDTVVPASAIEEVNIYYEDFYTPRYMKVSSDAKAINPFTGEEVGTTKAGEVSKYSTKIEREDGWYYRTEKDSNERNDVVVPASHIIEND